MTRGIEVSCALPPSNAAVSHAVLAERLGYRRASLYDSLAVYPDAWMALARCAAATTTIGLGPAVLVPSLRHPMVTAAAISGLVEQSSGRVAVAVGADRTRRLGLGRW
jgi:5,10-methylenetetrahydromethanopterin reductase